MSKLLTVLLTLAAATQASAATYCGVLQPNRGTIVVNDGRFNVVIDPTGTEGYAEYADFGPGLRYGACRCVSGRAINSDGDWYMQSLTGVSNCRRN